MVNSKDLGDAAIAIREALDELGVLFGIFGGYAIAAMGGPRESKDIDCAVNCEKEWLVEQLQSRSDFKYMGNSRKDLAAFLYGTRGVLVEFFPTSMTGMTTIRIPVEGRLRGQEATFILDPVLVFKGKLFAAATRNKFSDAADLLWLADVHTDLLKSRSRELSRNLVGRVAERHAHLRRTFEKLVGQQVLEAAIQSSRNADSSPSTVIQQNQVQNGLLFGLPAAVSIAHDTTSALSSLATQLSKVELAANPAQASTRSTQSTAPAGSEEGRVVDALIKKGFSREEAQAKGRELLALSILMKNGMSKRDAERHIRERKQGRVGAVAGPSTALEQRTQTALSPTEQASKEVQQAIESLMEKGWSREEAGEKYRELLAVNALMQKSGLSRAEAFAQVEDYKNRQGETATRTKGKGKGKAKDV